MINKPNEYIDIVFDGPPSHESGRFVEVEDASGASIRIGEWVEVDEFWVLRMPDPRRIKALETDLATARKVADDLVTTHGEELKEKDRKRLELEFKLGAADELFPIESAEVE